MTVIAWNGQSIAADKQQTNGNTIAGVTKLHRLKKGGIAAFTGAADFGLALKHWYESGAKPEKWPQFNSDDYRCLIIWDKRGLRYYERTPHPIVVEDTFAAFGCGRDFALAAMYLGKDPVDAVLVANRFDNGCGVGVDVMTLDG